MKIQLKNDPGCCYMPLLPRDNPGELQRAILSYFIQSFYKLSCIFQIYGISSFPLKLEPFDKDSM